jgi:hypothetical protein
MAGVQYENKAHESVGDCCVESPAPMALALRRYQLLRSTRDREGKKGSRDAVLKNVVNGNKLQEIMKTRRQDWGGDASVLWKPRARHTFRRANAETVLSPTTSADCRGQHCKRTGSEGEL